MKDTMPGLAEAMRAGAEPGVFPGIHHGDRCRMFRTVVGRNSRVCERLILSGKLLAGVAAAWAVGTSVFVATSRVAAAHDQPWFQAHGPWGMAWLFLFCGLYLLAVRLAWQGKYAAQAGVAIAAVALSVITGFSIGSAYLPAALGLLIATLMLLSSRWLQQR